MFDAKVDRFVIVIGLAWLCSCGGARAYSARERFEADQFPKIRERASEDLKCPREQLELTEMPSGDWYSYFVRGCGQAATYSMDCKHEWIQAPHPCLDMFRRKAE
jgi:hypothetical protein